MPFTIPTAWSRVTVRTMVALCAVALLAGMVAVGSEPADATGLSDQISTSRSGQAYAASAMLAQDRTLGQIKLQKKATQKALRQVRRALTQSLRALGEANSVLRERRSRFERVDALYADPSEAPLPEVYSARLQQLRKDIKVAERRKTTIARRIRSLKGNIRSKEIRLRALKRQRSAAISRREVAEASLAARIMQMTALARERVDNQAATLASGRSLSWPTTGRISQRYGCTGFRLNPRRGSCRHFHDGVDIVNVQGTPVRAIRVGVVAYSGWNPWDEGGRAWIVVIVHPGGVVSRYGHMVPSDRVRAGDVVHTGQIVGKMGNTGNSTGTHLHLEILVNGRDVNPSGYLPTGVIKVDKASTKKGQQQARKKAKLTSQKKRRARVQRRQAALAKADAEIVALTLDACERSYRPYEAGDVRSTADPSDPSALERCQVAAAVAAQTGAPEDPSTPGSEDAVRAALVSNEIEGVPQPERGTSPVPV